jgi:hypothetical protein
MQNPTLIPNFALKPPQNGPFPQLRLPPVWALERRHRARPVGAARDPRQAPRAADRKGGGGGVSFGGWLLRKKDAGGRDASIGVGFIGRGRV